MIISATLLDSIFGALTRFSEQLRLLTHLERADNDADILVALAICRLDDACCLLQTAIATTSGSCPLVYTVKILEGDASRNPVLEGA